MEYTFTLFKRLGLYAPKATTDDTFDMRLNRIATREQRRTVAKPLFVRQGL